MTFKNQARRIAIVEPVEANGGVPVNLQDQTSPLLAAYFSQGIGDFTLAADTAVSTLTTLEYDFTASPGHGFSVGDAGILLEVVLDKSLSFQVVGVAGDVITIDRPLDAVYAAATTLGRRTLVNMAVNGSVTPQIFTMRAGSNPIDISQVSLTMLSAVDMDDGKFGSLPALTNGLVMRFYDPNGTQTTIFNIKTNSDFKLWTTTFAYAAKAPAGQYGLFHNTHFGGQYGYGVTIRVSGLQVLQLIVQDDLTGLDTLYTTAKGHQVTD